MLISVPACWTDRVPSDTVVTLSAGRSPLRLKDPLGLTRLVAALEQEAVGDRWLDVPESGCNSR